MFSPKPRNRISAPLPVRGVESNKSMANRDKPAPSCVCTVMRLVLATILTLSLGLLPIDTARAETGDAPAAAMSCHDMIGDAGDMDHGDQSPDDGMQACADYCLSQVNGQTSYARVPGPSLVNAICAGLVEHIDLGKLHYRDPPDPPPPRIYA